MVAGRPKRLPITLEMVAGAPNGLPIALEMESVHQMGFQSRWKWNLVHQMGFQSRWKWNLVDQLPFPTFLGKLTNTRLQSAFFLQGAQFGICDVVLFRLIVNINQRNGGISLRNANDVRDNPRAAALPFAFRRNLHPHFAESFAQVGTHLWIFLQFRNQLQQVRLQRFITFVQAFDGPVERGIGANIIAH